MTALSADRPSTNPQDDLFGHAPFAESLANSICRYPGTRSQTVGDWDVCLQPRLNPAWLDRYIDTAACAQGLIYLRQVGAIPDAASEAVDQFLKEFEMLKAGKNPDGVGAFDD